MRFFFSRFFRGTGCIWLRGDRYMSIGMSNCHCSVSPTQPAFRRKGLAPQPVAGVHAGWHLCAYVINIYRTPDRVRCRRSRDQIFEFSQISTRFSTEFLDFSNVHVLFNGILKFYQIFTSFSTGFSNFLRFPRAFQQNSQIQP